jgi:N-acetylglucosaminyldiphosphoundecaprenol N-acetyl-beta-D-mannosaminyltransferase
MLPQRIFYRFQSPEITFVLGLRIFLGDLNDLKRLLSQSCSDGQSVVISCVNPHSFVLSRLYPDFRYALARSSACICDGIGFYYVVVLRLFFSSLRLQRLTGRQLFAAAVGVAAEHDLVPVCILPSQRYIPPVEQFFMSSVGRKPFIFVPPYSLRINSRFIVESLCESNLPLDRLAIFLFVGAPKQEILAVETMSYVKRSMLIPVGGVVDEIGLPVSHSYARFKRLASRCGFEWLFRFLNEPLRMYKRLIVSTIIFFGLALSSFVMLPLKKLLRWFFV